MEHQLFTVGVKALIQNESGKYLVLLKDKKECARDSLKAHWDIPGGRVDKGESMDKTLLRELKEEIGITSSQIGDLIGVTVSKFEKFFADSKLLLIVYLVTISEKQEIILNKEHTEYRWVGKKEAMKLLADKYPKQFLYTIFNTI